MYILLAKKNDYGQYGCIQSWDSKEVPEGFLEFPPEKWDIFFPPDKKCSGFVDLKVDGDRIVNVTWNEDAYQAYLAELPEPVDPPEDPDPSASLEDRIAAVEANTAALTAAIERGLSL